jgi:hypothetical protein
MYPDKDQPKSETTVTPVETPSVKTPPSVDTPTNKVTGATTDPPKKKKKLALVIILSILGVLLLSGAGFAIWFVSYLGSDAKILSDAFQKTLATKNLSLKGEVTVEDDDVNTDNKFSLSLESRTIDQTMFMDADLDAKVQGMSFNVGSSVLYAESGNLYVQVKNLDKMLKETGLSQYLSGLDVSQYSDKWIRIEKSLLDQYEKQLSANSDNEVTECMENVSNKITEDKNIRSDLLKAINSSEFFSVERYGVEDVNGRQSIKYNLTINSENAKLLGDQLATVEVISEIADCVDGDVDELGTELNDMVEQIDDEDISVEFSFWIDKENHEPTRFIVNASGSDVIARADFAVSFNPESLPSEPTTYIDIEDLVYNISRQLNNPESLPFALPGVLEDFTGTDF